MTAPDAEVEYEEVELEIVDDYEAASPPPAWYDGEGHDDPERLEDVDTSEPAEEV